MITYYDEENCLADVPSGSGSWILDSWHLAVLDENEYVCAVCHVGRVAESEAEA